MPKCLSEHKMKERISKRDSRTSTGASIASSNFVAAVLISLLSTTGVMILMIIKEFKQPELQMNQEI